MEGLQRYRDARLAASEARLLAARAFVDRLRPVLDGFIAQGCTRRQIAARLNDLGIRAPLGATWFYSQVQRMVTQCVN